MIIIFIFFISGIYLIPIFHLYPIIIFLNFYFLLWGLIALSQSAPCIPLLPTTVIQIKYKLPSLSTFLILKDLCPNHSINPFPCILKLHLFFLPHFFLKVWHYFATFESHFTYYEYFPPLSYFPLPVTISIILAFSALAGVLWYLKSYLQAILSFLRIFQSVLRPDFLGFNFLESFALTHTLSFLLIHSVFLLSSPALLFFDDIFLFILSFCFFLPQATFLLWRLNSLFLQKSLLVSNSVRQDLSEPYHIGFVHFLLFIEVSLLQNSSILYSFISDSFASQLFYTILSHVQASYEFFSSRFIDSLLPF